ncbi:39 kDa FK506-binding nuclear protein-like [Argopecten irradians]|uniref:39 kDa FK506-binding nuclear protein-like n=1 Tax=Argopecten irradians TaxID=31199 RepID=UPI003721DB61
MAQYYCRVKYTSCFGAREIQSDHIAGIYIDKNDKYLLRIRVSAPCSTVTECSERRGLKTIHNNVKRKKFVITRHIRSRSDDEDNDDEDDDDDEDDEEDDGGGEDDEEEEDNDEEEEDYDEEEDKDEEEEDYDDDKDYDEEEEEEEEDDDDEKEEG